MDISFYRRHTRNRVGSSTQAIAAMNDFSANPNGPAGAGLPNPVPNDYAGDIYLVPDNGQWDTVIYSPTEK